jgi:hypothetical protein
MAHERNSAPKTRLQLNPDLSNSNVSEIVKRIAAIFYKPEG